MVTGPTEGHTMSRSQEGKHCFLSNNFNSYLKLYQESIFRVRADPVWLPQLIRITVQTVFKFTSEVGLQSLFRKKRFQIIQWRSVEIVVLTLPRQLLLPYRRECLFGYPSSKIFL
jgi:hypothetical protein